MNWVDVAILVIITLSAIISLFRGFVREAVSLASWILAFWVSISFSDRLVPMLEGLISSPTIRLTVAFSVLFLVTLLVGALINYIIGQLVQKTGMGGTDRVLGVLFGIGRGLLLVGILVMLGGIPQLSHESWWQESMFIARFQEMAIWIRDFLPPDVARNFVF
ncbi:MAG TPA: CvpA family protein [Gammaproteobacteria bacterium]|nr:CvpA family protein [Gammaproteobacteria bacterium]